MRSILLIGSFPEEWTTRKLLATYNVDHYPNIDAAWQQLSNRMIRRESLPEAILCRASGTELWAAQKFCKALEKSIATRPIPLILFSNDQSSLARQTYAALGVFDVLVADADYSVVERRLADLIRMGDRTTAETYRNLPPIPFWKRAMDIAGAGLLILMLSPLFLLVALLIKLESKGPITYAAKRAGRGFQEFPFYKFRSMRPDADKLLAQMKHLNQYDSTADTVEPETTPALVGLELFEDTGSIAEHVYEQREAQEKGSTFVKIPNDPRITRVGKIIRNTSIDELPQLFNVLLGHMSLVGNRPLPLYEAEQLTSDEWVERFTAPAGITGLWQVTERGKEGVTPESRIRLDIEYARNYSLWLDLKILFKTLPAAIQKVGV